MYNNTLHKYYIYDKRYIISKIVSDLKLGNDKEPEIICNHTVIKFYKFTKKLKIRLRSKNHQLKIKKLQKVVLKTQHQNLRI